MLPVHLPLARLGHFAACSPGHGGRGWWGKVKNTKFGNSFPETCPNYKHVAKSLWYLNNFIYIAINKLIWRYYNGAAPDIQLQHRKLSILADSIFTVGNNKNSSRVSVMSCVSLLIISSFIESFCSPRLLRGAGEGGRGEGRLPRAPRQETPAPCFSSSHRPPAPACPVASALVNGQENDDYCLTGHFIPRYCWESHKQLTKLWPKQTSFNWWHGKHIQNVTSNKCCH